MDANGNIGLAYTTVSSTQYPSLRFTGRQASDPVGTMTIAEEVIINGVQSDPSTRYGDYSQMTVDPVDDATFWSIGEYFASGTRKNRVGTFQIGPPALNAAFTANPTTVCSGGTVSFTNQSSGLPTSWLWSFPGGTPASYNGQNPPSITYSTTGTYNVTLTVSDGSTTDVETKTGYITVKNIVAEFTGTPTTVIVGNTVTFTDNSLCNPTSRNWSFSPNTITYAAGTNSSSQNPVVNFLSTGYYTVSLTVTNAAGTDMITKQNYINSTTCTHCTSTSSNATEEWISNVTFNTINNTSAGSVGYQNFTAISTNVIRGSVYSLSASCGSTGSWTEHCRAFADWNQDCDFTDTGESFDLGQVTGPGTMTLSITIPSGATIGSTRLRVSLKYSADPTSCETFTYGQVEDYTINVQSAAPTLSVSLAATEKQAPNFF
jgi:PKD repeat protein